MFNDPFRAGLDDNLPINFTHGDLHPGNIIISRGSGPRICAIVDWHQSGWLPESWEYCKACMTADIGGEWERRYIPMFLEPWDSYYRSYDFYAGALGF
jgi:aminoglycoside phosphotransferase (APT) family kinase protein